MNEQFAIYGQGQSEAGPFRRPSAHWVQSLEKQHKFQAEAQEWAILSKLLSTSPKHTLNCDRARINLLHLCRRPKLFIDRKGKEMEDRNLNVVYIGSSC